MTINRVEYLIILSALTETEIFINVASDWRLSHAEVVSAANRLFQSGDILAAFSLENGENIRGVALTISQIWASLNGKLNAFYYLTSQGGARWEGLTGANWNHYHKWCLGYQHDEITGLFRSEIICCSQQIIQEIINYCEYLENQILISETCFWEDIGFWKATYWKTLPKAYKVTYQHRYFELCIDSNTPQEWIDKERQAKQWYSEISHWYTEPELDTNASNLFGDEDINSYATLPENLNSKVEYLILDFAVIFNYYGLRNVAYSNHLSHAETALAANSLFQRGDIKARVFADEHDTEGTSNVVLTMAGIQDHLDERFNATYYLTPQGGARWEAMAHPDWNKFFIVNFLGQFPYEEGFFCTQREILEQLLALERLIFMYEHIPGTEKWNVLEPWEATYWKTLPRGYHVSCEFQPNDSSLDYQKEGASPELIEEYQQARQWYENMKKWYTDPYFD
ncbi:MULTISPECIES: hypothetical protein [Kamptonema]|uniref:hypothetical protein n=1 Tax=Kamptonema TaxID=1501433 RepID=UPI0001DAC8FE|nr:MULTISPECIES: hypothetical protein [Kamptonema]CBN53848.1 hypothetical protein OSCI_300002 [Kamptonema sp. PCC 6506]